MTSTATPANQRLSRIHEAGYWRVILHPTKFHPRRILSLDDCWRLVIDSQVTLRHVVYPHVDTQDRQYGDDWVQSGGDWRTEVEFWRFYQSGQFVQHLSLPEDRVSPWNESEHQKSGAVVKGPRTLNVFDALYTITEVLMFARGLAYRDVFEPSASLRIELRGMRGRRLIAPQRRWLEKDLESQEDTICWKGAISAIALLTTAPEIALDAATHVFKRFGWNKPPWKLIEEEQRRLMEHRL